MQANIICPKSARRELWKVWLLLCWSGQLTHFCVNAGQEITLPVGNRVDSPACTKLTCFCQHTCMPAHGLGRSSRAQYVPQLLKGFSWLYAETKLSAKQALINKPWKISTKIISLVIHGVTNAPTKIFHLPAYKTLVIRRRCLPATKNPNKQTKKPETPFPERYHIFFLIFH